MEKITSPHKLKKIIMNDHMAYVETIGKSDIEALREVALSPEGTGTVVRLFMGATTQMPLRALSYVTSAARVAEQLPCTQLQIISVNKLGERINGIDYIRAKKQFELLALVGTAMIRGFMPEAAKKLVFAEDTHNDFVDKLVPTSEQALRLNPEIALSLSSKGAKHGGDFVAYGAAHLAYQDTDRLELSVLGDRLEPVIPERIVSVGCQQERVFYAHRMAMRRLVEPSVLVPSVQVFTRHISPPYYEARHGEQSLEDALQNGVNLDQTRDLAAHRDLSHLVTIMNGVNHE